jgi:nitrite reductase/ring-hydroxylating ferredoxin subunit
VHLDNRTTDAEPAPTFVPVDAYADESTRLFRELPLVVGHVSQLAAPGDFFTHDATGVPLLVVRGDDGELRAFLNVCRHRGTRVEPAACGTRKAFVCPYHAWSYGCDGALIGFASTATAELIDMHGRVQAKDFPGAFAIWDRLGPLARYCWRAPIRDYRPRMKEVLQMQGLIAHATVRPPQLGVDADERAVLRKLADAAGLLGERADARRVDERVETPT